VPANRLDASPLALELAAWCDGGRLIQDLAGDSGVSDRTIRRIIHGKSTHIELGTADLLSVAIDIPLHAIYPTLRDVP
jgi:hypothetical protein